MKNLLFFILIEIDGKRRMFVSILFCDSEMSVVYANIDRPMRKVTHNNSLPWIQPNLRFKNLSLVALILF